MLHSKLCTTRTLQTCKVPVQPRRGFRCRSSKLLCASMSDEKPWTLWYWPGIKGRGEYIRLVFEELGVPYTEPSRAEGANGFQVILDWTWKGGNTGFPVRAPPAIERDGFVVSDTSVTMSYLGRKYRLHGVTLEDQSHVDQCLAVVTDAVLEGRLAFHPTNFYATHKGQEEASLQYREQYGSERLPKHMKYFEDILSRATPQGPGGDRFLVGGSLTVADLAVYHFLAAAQEHYRAAYDAVEAPLCKALQAQVAARPNIAAYLASDRVLPWDKDSMM